MIEILPLAGHVAAFRVSGTLTDKDYGQIIAEVEAKLKAHQRIGLYTDMVEFGDITGDALAHDVRYGLSKLEEMDRFARNAVITDKEWLRSAVRFVQGFLPRIELRTFASSERDAAKAWIVEPL